MPADRTLFTQTGPTAVSKEPYRGTRIPIEPGPPGELPLEKVARLRTARQKALLQRGSTWDRIVIKGRTVADKLHRVTFLTLFSFSVGFGVYTLLCVGDMMAYNRRKRTEFYAVMEKLRSDEYEKALQAEAKGQATDDQMLLINQEHARFEQIRLDQEKKAKGMYRRLKESLIGTETYEEPKGGTLGVGRRRQETAGVTGAVSEMLAARDGKMDAAAAPNTGREGP